MINLWKTLGKNLRSILPIVLITSMILGVTIWGISTISDVDFGQSTSPFWNGLVDVFFGGWSGLILALLITPTIGIWFLVWKRMLDDKNILPRRYQPHNSTNKEDGAPEERIMREKSGTKTEEQ